MQSNLRTLESIINNEALDYAMYTVESRAIPNMVDGLKPVQRFVIQRAINLAESTSYKKFHKLASIAGGIADLGYHHAETAAQEAAALIANTWNNNFQLLDGQGNFGSRILQEAAASRYIFGRVSNNFVKIYKDTNIAPVHKDLEHIPPQFFLPLIPVVLLNGVSGIATGYSTSILPHSLESVIECTLLALKGKLNKEPEVKFPEFVGKIVEYETGKYELHGEYKWVTPNQIYISEVPYKWERESYKTKVLDKLEDANLISVDDDCGENGFGFKIKFKKEYFSNENESQRHEKIVKDFKLIERVSQNLVVVDEKGRLNDRFNTASELIKEFVKIRLPYIQTRIDKNIKEVSEKLAYAEAKAAFITEVINGSIKVSGKKKAHLVQDIKEYPEFKDYAEQLVSMNIYHMTSDELEKLKDVADKLSKELNHWKSTSAEKEYEKDLKDILK